MYFDSADKSCVMLRRSITVPIKGSAGSESCKSAESWREGDEAMSMFMSTISGITSY